MTLQASTACQACRRKVSLQASAPCVMKHEQARWKLVRPILYLNACAVIHGMPDFAHDARTACLLPYSAWDVHSSSRQLTQLHAYLLNLHYGEQVGGSNKCNDRCSDCSQSPSSCSWTQPTRTARHLHQEIIRMLLA